MRRDDVLVEVDDLHMYFPVKGGVFKRKVADLKAVDGISFHIKRGETLGLVGESGCGKTTTGRCLLRLYEATGGRVFYDGKDLSKLSDGKMRRLRRQMQMIFENPGSALDPRMLVGDILAEPLLLHNLARPEVCPQIVGELLIKVGLEPDMAERHPNEFSGGERQRIEMARALALRPDFLICDNPVAQLDVSIQAQIIAMLMRLQKERNLTYLFIAHDLAVVRNISDRVMVMYVGKIMETASTDELFNNPLHPYTKALLSAVLTPDPKVERERKVIILPGEIPSSIDPPSGCRFHPRCRNPLEICREQEPQLENNGHEHWVACHRV
ncbi:MAG: ATP-binding cassette domain-containing protein [Chloroflexi bacterium]|nr:ATP-binding cassette domain-containing protein [Chloroflexota bacterium]